MFSTTRPRFVQPRFSPPRPAPPFPPSPLRSKRFPTRAFQIIPLQQPDQLLVVHLSFHYPSILFSPSGENEKKMRTRSRLLLPLLLLLSRCREKLIRLPPRTPPRVNICTLCEKSSLPWKLGSPPILYHQLHPELALGPRIIRSLNTIPRGIAFIPFCPRERTNNKCHERQQESRRYEDFSLGTEDIHPDFILFNFDFCDFFGLTEIGLFDRQKLLYGKSVSTTIFPHRLFIGRGGSDHLEEQTRGETASRFDPTLATRHAFAFETDKCGNRTHSAKLRSTRNNLATRV